MKNIRITKRRRRRRRRRRSRGGDVLSK